MYVSSRVDGTRPFRQLDAQEFHRMQWNPELCVKGRLVEQRPLDVDSGSSDQRNVRPSKAKAEVPGSYSDQVGSSTKSHGERRDFFRRISRRNKRNSTGAVDLPLDIQDSLSDLAIKAEGNYQAPNVDDREIPNAVFARKFGLLTNDSPLPPCIRELPVAEDKAMDMAKETGMKDLMYSWRFRGPFTPQLWFDSGLEYRWKRR